eukprot:scaffold433_cov257-Pinguiococcus_pyrenoidosus.AAC.11
MRDVSRFRVPHLLTAPTAAPAMVSKPIAIGIEEQKTGWETNAASRCGEAQQQQHKQRGNGWIL